MPILLLMILMAASMPVQWPPPVFDLDPIHSVSATGASVLAFLLLCRFFSWRTVWKLTRVGADTARIGSRYGRVRSLLFLGSLALYAFDLFVLGWGWAISDLLTIRTSGGKWVELPTLGQFIFPAATEKTASWLVLPGAEFMTLLPLLAVMIGSWFIFYDVEREFHRLGIDDSNEAFWTRGGYVLYRARQFLFLVFVPVFLLMVQQGLLRLYPDLNDSVWMRFVSILTIPFLLIFLPMLLPTLLGWRPLPDGPARDRLVAHAKRLGFSYREIYLWDTRHGMANAMVVGVIPRARFVIFTDRLLEEMSDDEIDGVFGHEVGHARHGHLLYYALFLLLSVLTIGAIYEVIRKEGGIDANESQNWLILGPIVVIGLYLFLVFGFLSRRCERQADLFGCRAGSCGDPNCRGHDAKTVLVPRGDGLCPTGIDAFVRALRKVESLNGMTPTRRNDRRGPLSALFGWVRVLTLWLQTWQHSTIDKRVAFLRRVESDFGVERRFQGSVFLLRVFFLATLLGTLTTLAVVWGPKVILGGI